MVDRAEDYLWSSYNSYVGKAKRPEWLKSDFILGYFDQRESAAQRKYEQFVKLMLGKSYESPLKDVTASTILGDKFFVTEIMEKYLDRKKRDRNLPSRGMLREERSVKEICEAVVVLAGEDKKTVTGMSIYLCHRYSGAGLKEIGAQFGISESGITRASQRFGEKIEGDKGLKSLLVKVKNELGISIA